MSAWIPSTRRPEAVSSDRVLTLLSANRAGRMSALHLLGLHHVTYWVSYQPASRMPLFQGVAALLLLVLAAIATMVTVRRLRHLA